MYVHIGKDVVINSDNIISILDIESLEKNKKSLIILEKNNKIMGYITNISSSTLAKRASK